MGALPGAGSPPPAGTVHFWFAAPVQVQICRRVPLAELLPAASRHLSAGTETMSRAAETDQRWLAPPVQSHSCVTEPLAVPPSLTSRHLPSARIVPSEPTFHCWAAVPLQS